METKHTQGPGRIWLQHDPDNEGGAFEPSDITWCCDKINNNDLEYLRADVTLSALETAEKRIAQLCETVNTLAGFRKVRPDDFTEEVRAAIAKATRANS